MKTKNYFVSFPALCLFMVGCSVERNLKLDARLPVSPAVRQMPLHIGVYYSPEFVEYNKKFRLTACGPYGRRDQTDVFFVFPVGAASRDLFDQIIASMSAIVTKASTPPQSLHSALPFDGLLVPQIESFNWEMVCSENYLSTGRIRASVGYVFKTYGSDGHLVASIKAVGTSTEKPNLCFKDCKDSPATDQAIQDAMAKFMIEFHDNPEVQQWISSHIAVPGNLQ